MHDRPDTVAARPLDREERAALMFLVSADFEGVRELRAQAEVAEVVRDQRACCATIGLRVDRLLAPQAHVHEPIPVEARSRPGFPARELLLFVRDGWLTVLELVHYEEEPGPRVFPDPVTFEAPSFVST